MTRGLAILTLCGAFVVFAPLPARALEPCTGSIPLVDTRGNTLATAVASADPATGDLFVRIDGVDGYRLDTSWVEGGPTTADLATTFHLTRSQKPRLARFTSRNLDRDADHSVHIIPGDFDSPVDVHLAIRARVELPASEERGTHRRRATVWTSGTLFNGNRRLGGYSDCILTPLAGRLDTYLWGIVYHFSDPGQNFPFVIDDPGQGVLSNDGGIGLTAELFGTPTVHSSPGDVVGSPAASFGLTVNLQPDGTFTVARGNGSIASGELRFNYTVRDIFDRIAPSQVSIFLDPVLEGDKLTPEELARQQAIFSSYNPGSNTVTIPCGPSESLSLNFSTPIAVTGFASTPGGVIAQSSFTIQAVVPVAGGGSESIGVTTATFSQSFTTFGGMASSAPSTVTFTSFSGSATPVATFTATVANPAPTMVIGQAPTYAFTPASCPSPPG